MANTPVIVAARYPRLYEALRQTVQRALDLLRTALPDPLHWPVRQTYRIVFEETRSYSQSQVEEFPEETLQTILETLRASEPFRHALDELGRLEGEGRATPAMFGMENTFLIPVISKYLAAQRNLEFSEHRFQEVYYELEDYLGGDSVSFRLYCQLWGLEGEIQEVRLSETHRIYKVDENEANRVWRIISPPGIPRLFRGFLDTWPHIRSYLLAAETRISKGQLNQMSILLGEEIARVTTALRLSAIGSGPVVPYTYEELGFRVAPGRFGFAPNFKVGHASSYSYRLDTLNAETLRQNWPVAYEFSACAHKTPDKIPTHMRIAGLRFSSSFEKETNQDRLIDYAIALEALFTKENDAISYRLPLRAAIFLGDTAAERERVFYLAKAAYDLRSSLAHGHSQLDDKVKLRGIKMTTGEFLDDIRAILFNSLHLFLKATRTVKSKDVVLGEIDKAIISLDRTGVERFWSAGV
jgi:hypothetical protein